MKIVIRWLTLVFSFTYSPFFANFQLIWELVLYVDGFRLEKWLILDQPLLSFAEC